MLVLLEKMATTLWLVVPVRGGGDLHVGGVSPQVSDPADGGGGAHCQLICGYNRRCLLAMVWWIVGGSGVVTVSVSFPDLMMRMMAIVILWIIVIIVIPGFGLQCLNFLLNCGV